MFRCLNVCPTVLMSRAKMDSSAGRASPLHMEEAVLSSLVQFGNITNIF